MNVRIITASAGTGKTTRLAEVLEEAIGSGQARPEAIVATTFTKQAAAELQNRARTRLLNKGKGREAQALLTARIGTVNAVCGSLVDDFSFELALSPELRVLDEPAAALELQRALASVVSEEDSARLEAFKKKFDREFDWHYEVQRLIEAARANGLDTAALAASRRRSIESLDRCLGPVEGDDLDQALGQALDAALSAIDTNLDQTKATKEYVALLTECRRHLGDGRLRWGKWALLARNEPGKKSVPHAAPVQAVAARHIGHPRLRQDMHELIGRMFDVAARGLDAYQARKRDRGLLDFGDQEVLALALLRRPDICEILREQLDLVLVDEFQDTSPLQLAIFLQLAELARQSVWVGDTKQAIYGFRGTDPSLMDAAIETLTSPSRDPDLVAEAVEAVGAQSRQVEPLRRSYRSRPALVELTNAVFAGAFRSQGMPEDRVRLEPARAESTALGPAVSHFRLELPKKETGNAALASALAEGVRALLAGRPVVWDRTLNAERPARPSDVAVLCRTNVQCRNVAEALGTAGIASVVARTGLLDTPEAQLLAAGLRLWVDGRDRLAAATLVRWIEHPDDPAAFVSRTLAEDDDLLTAPPVAAVLAARAANPDRDVVDAVDAVVDALDLRRLAAGWGREAQRIANLDAFRAHAVCYREERLAGGAAPSIVGFLGYLQTLVDPLGWGQQRQDTLARVGSQDAVTVSTWHAAKGLEWPIVVLFGLESMREPQAYGVHVLSDRSAFDVHDPLGGRWLHFWPNPYTTSNQGGAIKDAYARSAAHETIRSKAAREALRVLYVGWTRAADRLVLAAQKGKLCNGIVGTLTEIDAGLVTVPPDTATGAVPLRWAGHPFDLHVAAYQPLAVPEAVPDAPGRVRVGRPPAEYPPASLVPSSAPPRPARLGEPVRLGEPISWQAAVESEALGTAVHAFLAADDPAAGAELRRAMAERLLPGQGVQAALAPERLLEIADRLWGWTRARFGAACRLRREWPVAHRLPGGTVVAGTADLLVEADGAVAVVDHKSYRLAAAEGKVEALAGQLGCYADAVARAGGMPGAVSTWVHLPFEGVVVPVVVADP